MSGHYADTGGRIVEAPEETRRPLTGTLCAPVRECIRHAKLFDDNAAVGLA